MTNITHATAKLSIIWAILTQCRQVCCKKYNVIQQFRNYGFYLLNNCGILSYTFKIAVLVYLLLTKGSPSYSLRSSCANSWIFNRFVLCKHLFLIHALVEIHYNLLQKQINLFLDIRAFLEISIIYRRKGGRQINCMFGCFI